MPTVAAVLRMARDVRELRTDGRAAGVRQASPRRPSAEKAIDHVDAESARFIAASPFLLLATTAADGSCDVSPRGDPAGSVLVLDERTLAFGDRKGEPQAGQHDQHPCSRPQVGMRLPLCPGWGDTLRINGSARIVADRGPTSAAHGGGGDDRELAVEVRVEELFLHCSKAFARAALWDTAVLAGEGRRCRRAGQIVRSQHKLPVPAKLIDKMLRQDARVNRY